MGSFFTQFPTATNTGVTGGQLGGATYAPDGSITAPGFYAPPAITSADPRIQTQPQPYQQGPITGSAVVAGPPLINPRTGQPYTDASQLQPGDFGPYQTLQGGGGNTGVTGGQLGGVQPQSGGDYQSEFMQAAQELGISPQQFRGNPQVMDQVTNYLNQKYPGQNWTNGGQRAGDWVSANGQGFDVLPAGDANWQWLSDPANSTAGSGGSLGTIGAGAGLAGSLMGAGGDPTKIIQDTPGYKFDFDEAMRAIQHSAAAKGTLLSGGLLKELGGYIGNSVAGPAYQRQVGNLFNLAGLGENAAAMTGNAASGYANSASNTLAGIGNANAAGSTAQGNLWGSAINNIGQIGASSYLNAQNPYQAAPNGYNPMGVNGYGVNTIPVQNG